MHSSKLLKILILTILLWTLFILTPRGTDASCSGTPTSCASLAQTPCGSCGCTWNAGSCSNNGTCSGLTQAPCESCSCANCSWGGTSCPWVASWNGQDWILEHESFPFAAFAGVKDTTYDALQELKCTNGETKIKIYEGLPEKTSLDKFTVYRVPNYNGTIKPDLEGRPRTLNEAISPTKCNSSSKTKENEDCLGLLEEQDSSFWEPKFNKDRTEDWMVVEFDNIETDDNKLYVVARKQTFLTTYYEYMAHMMGREGFAKFSKISEWPLINNVISNWWDENLKMQVEVWDGKEWKKEGLISAGYHLTGTGADDFLVSIEKLDETSDKLKVRFRFLTGAFGIDYLFLDTTEDPELKVEKLIPNEVKFNNRKVDYPAPREMVYDDNLTLSYKCEENDKFFFSISGHYLPDYYPPEREKKGICAWTELITFFLSGKENVVRNAQEKGLYKEARCLDQFESKDLKAQQRICPLFYAIWSVVGTIIIFICLYIWKRKKRPILSVFLFITLSFSLSTTLRMLSVSATQSCSGTLTCANCSEANCTSCSQCTWNAASCSGTPDVCTTHMDQTSCTTCGCTWTYTGLFVDIVDGTYTTISNPSLDFSQANVSFGTTETTATLGTSSQRIKVYNDSSSSTWTLSIAATNGETSEWESLTDSYKYNGSQSEGRLEVDPSSASITASGSGCTTTGVTSQTAQYFTSGSISSISLVIAGSSSQQNCSWYIEDIGLTQDIPALQSPGDYSIGMTISII